MKNDLPLCYRWIRANGVKRLIPWHFIDDLEWCERVRDEYLRESGGQSDVVPFAYRQDIDTIAAFSVANGAIMNQVMTVHLSWSGKKERWGRPNPNELPSFERWMMATMLADSIEWMTEDDLELLKTGTWPNVRR